MISSEPPLSDADKVSEILNIFQSHRKGERRSPWLALDLQTEDYTRLLQTLEENESLRRYVEDKLRVGHHNPAVMLDRTEAGSEVRLQ